MFDSIRTIPVRVRPPYDVRIGSGLLGRCGDYLAALLGQRRIAVLADDTVASLYLDTVTAALEDAGFAVCSHIFPSGEGRKNLSTLTELLEFLASEHLTRTDCVAALGGGVTGDMAGFAAAVYLRGIRYVQLPTTLLAAVDSSVGGKVAIDLPAGKNLAGAFWQPRLVLMDPACLRTLDDKTFSDGMAEVIKYGCIRDRAFFDFLCAHSSRAAVMEHIDSVLYTCCDIKRQVVVEDERDTGVRMILNFGHTVGHAFEKAGGYETWTHGQAVAAGMVAAERLGAALGVSDGDGFSELLEVLSAFGLPTHIDCDWSAIVEAVGLDKKGDGEAITMIFLSHMGRALPMKMKKEDVLQNLAHVCGR